MDGGTSELDSIWEADEPSETQPPTDDVAQAIAEAIDNPQFMKWLLAYTLGQARGHHRAQFLGYSMGQDLPGGMCVESLVHTLLERILLGKRPWDREKYPNFLLFCKMHAGGMVQNLFNSSDTIQRRSVSPVEEEDEEGNPIRTEVTEHTSAKEEGNRVQHREEFNKIANAYLMDFALNLEEDSSEQKIIMAVIDNKDTVVESREGAVELFAVDRPYMVDKLKITPKEFDAGMKRLQRKHKAFIPGWLEEKGLTVQEIGGLLHG